ncbi:hypothetical protein EBU71_00690 [bacterium]|nr:hypothetical protein [Candidatus Elulimicrobium humile]
MPAGYQDLFLEQGTTFTSTIVLDDIDGEPLDLTDITAKGQIRRSYYSANTTAEFIITIPSPTEGAVVLSLSANTTSNIAAGRYVYDVAIKDTSNTITRILEGTVSVLPQVTKF